MNNGLRNFIRSASVYSQSHTKPLRFSICLSLASLLSVSSLAAPVEWNNSDSTRYISTSLSPDRLEHRDNFGQNLYYFDSTLVVSTRQLPRSRLTGDVYIFVDTDNDGDFNEESFELLLPPASLDSDSFGQAITHSRNTLFISADSQDSPTNRLVGAVYQIIDSDQDNEFTDESITTILPFDDRFFGRFGHSLAATDDTLVIAASGSVVETGGVYVIVDSNNNGDFSDDFMSKIIGSGTRLNNFSGNSVDVEDHTIVVGAPSDTEAGVVYVIIDSD